MKVRLVVAGVEQGLLVKGRIAKNNVDMGISGYREGKRATR
jgi:hypothetical protein